jgi:hypothetical protein
MKISALLSITIFFALLSGGCTGKSHDPSAASSPPFKKTGDSLGFKAEPFIIPPDSTIAAAQMAAWFACNPKLDSLSLRFADSFSTENTSLHVPRCERIFSNAQDSICVGSGLRGGYKEYRWIMDNLGIAKNKRVFDSVRIQISKS